MDDFEQRYSAFVKDVADIRAEQDKIDTQLIELLAKRYECRRQTMPLKLKHDIPVEVGMRVQEVLNQVAEKAKENNFPEAMAQAFFKLIIDYSMQYEENYRAELNETKDKAHG